MAYCNDAVEIQRVFPGELAEIIGPVRDVPKRARPAAALIADATILETPDREAAVGKRLLDRAGVRDIVLGQPAPAMDEHDDRMRTGALRKPQIAELQGSWPILNPLIGRTAGQRWKVPGS